MLKGLNFEKLKDDDLRLLLKHNDFRLSYKDLKKLRERKRLNARDLQNMNLNNLDLQKLQLNDLLLKNRERLEDLKRLDLNNFDLQRLQDLQRFDLNNLDLQNLQPNDLQLQKLRISRSSGTTASTFSYLGILSSWILATLTFRILNLMIPSALTCSVLRGSILTGCSWTSTI